MKFVFLPPQSDPVPEWLPRLRTEVPGVAVVAPESDAGALRVFEETTGALLEELHLFRDGEAGHHVYYCDPDLVLEELDPPAGISLRYVAPVEIDVVGLPDEARALLTRFVVSSAYRAMFH